MSKHIDADFLRSAKVPYDEELSEWERGWNDACDALAEDALAADVVELEGSKACKCLSYTTTGMPTADVVPVVRCKECKYFYKVSKYCSEFMTKDEDGFCKWGERREDNA